MTDELVAYSVRMLRDIDADANVVAVDGDAVCTQEGWDPIVSIHTHTEHEQATTTMFVEDVERLIDDLRDAIEKAERHADAAEGGGR